MMASRRSIEELVKHQLLFFKILLYEKPGKQSRSPPPSSAAEPVDSSDWFGAIRLRLLNAGGAHTWLHGVHSFCSTGKILRSKVNFFESTWDKWTRENLSWVDQGFGIGDFLSKSWVRHCLPLLTCLRLGSIPSNAVPKESEPQKPENSRLFPQIFSFYKNAGRLCRGFGGAAAPPLLLIYRPWYRTLCP